MASWLVCLFPVRVVQVLSHGSASTSPDELMGNSRFSAGGNPVMD